jgi:predicted HAD superfamily Cof-like phosphohydrolase
MLISETERNKVLKQQSKVERALNEYLVFYGEDIFMEAFDRVHQSNMSKLGPDGKPIHREDGKVLKGPNYKEPDLTDLLERGP